MLTNGQISKLSDIVVGNIDRLFDYFQIPYRSGQTKIYMPCMIHGSDNCNSLNIYIDGYYVPFTWKCRSHHCECVFKKTIIGFTRALLSRDQGWTDKGDKEVGFNETIKFLSSLYKIDLSNIQEDPQEKDKSNFIAQVSYIENRRKNTHEKGVSREKVRQILEIPAKYYIDRGYSREILDKYDVGLCINPEKEMFQRVVVPVYNESGKLMIGCTARSVFEKCEKCVFYHDPTKPCPFTTSKYSKWRHNFESRFYLYNYWLAAPYLKDTATAIIVESPGNVWRLEEAGFHNSVGIFGTNLTQEQQFLLEKLGVMNLIIILDNDEAGNIAKKNIINDCERYYNLNFIDLPDQVNDIGQMSIEQIQKLMEK